MAALSTDFGDAATPLCRANTKRWLEMRRRGIGGSDIASIMGLGRHSALYIYESKINPQNDNDRKGQEWMEWGHTFEDPILDTYAKRSGRALKNGGVLLQNRLNPHWIVTLDSEQFDKDRGLGVAECKTVGFAKMYEPDIPLDVQIQVQWEMMVTGASWATCVWLPMLERALQWRDVEPHRAFQQQMADAAEDFWSRVCERRPPDPDGSDGSKDALYRMYPEDNAAAVLIAGPEAVKMAERYESNRQLIKKLEAEQDETKNAIRATMGETTYGLLDDGQYWSLKTTKEITFSCDACGVETGRRRAYRAPRLSAPPKTKQLPEATHGVALVSSVEAQLRASLKEG